MSTSNDNALPALLKKLGAAYDPRPFETRAPLEELIYSCLLWEATTQRADAAFRRFQDQFVDFNELRVTRPHLVVASLGKTYPLGEERAKRLLAILEDLYTREYAVTLDAAVKASKRDARKYLDSLEGINQFISARVALLVLDSHAVPVEDRLCTKLIAAEILPEGTTPEKAAGILERQIKSAETLEAYGLLQAFSEDTGSAAITAGKSAKGGKTTKKSTTKTGKAAKA